MQRRIMVAAAAYMAIFAPSATWAQGASGGHGHAHTGQEQKIGRYEVELVVRGTNERGCCARRPAAANARRIRQRPT